MNPGLPEPRSTAAASGPGMRLGWATTMASVASRRRRRRADGVGPGRHPAGDHQQCPLGAAQRRDEVRGRKVLAADPGGGHQHEALYALGVADRQLGRDVASHRVADHRRRAHAKGLQECVDDPRVAADRDLVAWHRRLAEPGQVDRDHPPLGREHRQLLEPVLPGAGQTMDEQQRWPAPELDHVDRSALDGDPALMLAPVDVEPRRARARAVHVPGPRTPVERGGRLHGL